MPAGSSRPRSSSAGGLAALVARAVWARLDDLVVLLAISLFLSLAIEPGVNWLSPRLAARSATALILFGVVIVFLLFVAASARSSGRRSPSC